MLNLKNRISPDHFLLFFLLLFGPLAHGLVETWSVTTAHLLVISLVSIAVLTRAYRGELKCYRTPVDIPIVLFLFLVLISYCTSVAPYASRIVIYKLLTAIALFFYIIHTQRSQEKINLLLWIIVILGTVYAVMGLTLVDGDFLGFKIFSKRYYNISLFYVNYNLFAGYLELVFCLAVGLAVAQKGGKRILLFGMTTLICLALLFSLSRGGIIGASGGLAFFLIASAFMQRKKTGYRLFFSAILLGLIIIAWFGLNPVLERLSTLEDLSVAGEARIQVWQDTLRMIAARPLSGWGPGTFSLAFPAYQTNGFEQKLVNYAHNDYLELAADIGLLGLLVFIIGIVFLYISCLKELRLAENRYWQNVGLGALAACFSILIHSVTDCNLQVPANLFLFVIATGIAVVAADNCRQKKDSLRANISLKSSGKRGLFFSGLLLIFSAGAATFSLPFWGERAITAATTSFRQKKYDDALAQVDRAFFLHPDHAELLSFKGDILLTKKIQTDTLIDINNCTGYENIILCYEKANNIAPTNSTYLIKKGIFFEQCKENDRAENAYSEAIRRSPMYAVPYYHLAFLYLKQRQLDDALKYFRHFLELAGVQKIQKVLDDIWSAGGGYETQKQAIPERALFRQAFARYLAIDGDIELAAQEAAFAFSLEPTVQNAMMHLNFLWQSKEFDRSLMESKKYLKQFPKEQKIKERYAATLARRHHYQEAILVYRQLIDEHPGDKKKFEEYHLKIARLYATNTLYKEAVVTLKQGLVKYPRSGNFYHRLGIYFRAMKKYSEALSAFKKAVSLSPNKPSFRYQLGEEYRRHKIEQEALREWKECLVINSTFTPCKKGIEDIRTKFGLPGSLNQ